MSEGAIKHGHSHPVFSHVTLDGGREMKRNIQKIGLLSFLLTISFSLLAQSRSSDSRTVMLKTGPEVVHNSIVLAPGGYPFAVSAEQIDRMLEAKRQRVEQGYVDRGLAYSMAEQALAHVDQSLSTYGRYPEGFSAIDEFDFGSLPVKVGQVRKDYIRPGSRMLIWNGGINIVERLYDDTVFGRLFVREIFGATVDVDVPQPNISIRNYTGYMTTIKYANDSWATMVVIGTEEEVLWVEVGSRITDGGRQNEMLLDRMLEDLLYSDEQ